VEEDCGLDVSAGSEASNDATDRRDFANDCLRDVVGNLMCTVTHNIPESLLDGVRHGLHRLELYVNYSAVPLVIKSIQGFLWLSFSLE
jgi:hypothetical protein